ncbi:hypothetical protein SESBI_21842 [Sesbania bispinosa]|nr:hypothetical protein SESBI_21842 [Sesbania bispinosa]
MTDVDIRSDNGVIDLSIDEATLREIPISFAEQLDDIRWTHSMQQKGTITRGIPKRMRGRPKKNSAMPQVGLDLGVSGFVNEDEMIGRLKDMEEREQVAIGRSRG